MKALPAPFQRVVGFPFPNSRMSRFLEGLPPRFHNTEFYFVSMAHTNQPLISNPLPEATPGPGQAEAERRRLILDSALDAIITIDAEGLVQDWNKRAEIMFGWTAQEAHGQIMSGMIIPPQHREGHERGMRHFLAGGEGPILNRRLEITAMRRDGSEFPIELSVAPARIDGKWMFSSFIRDLTEQKATENWNFLQTSTTRILAEAQSLEQGIGAVLEAILERTSWEVCGFWQQDEYPGGLRLTDMRYKPDGSFESFLAVSREMRFAEKVSIPGRVEAEGKPVWIASLADDPGFLRKPQALAAGFKSGLAFPVYLRNNLLGVFEFYSRAEIAESPELTETLVSMGRQLGQFIERKRAEEDLRRREEQLELIMDAAPALISYIGADRRYRFNNGAYEQWFGHSKAEIVGKTMWEVLGDTAYAKLKTRVDGVLAGEVQTFEDALPYRDGGTRYVSGHYLPHRRGDGVVEGFVVFIVDLSERRKTEEALLEKERFLESIYNGAEEAIWVMDVTPEEEFVFAGFNPAYLRRAENLGFDMRVMLGKTVKDMFGIFPDDAVNGVLRKYAECARTKLPMEYEESLVMETSTFHWMTRIAPLTDETGRTYRLIGTTNDITRQKEDAARIRHAEDQLRQSQKMEAIGRLAGGIAHDFNNLLTAIIGLSELAMVSMEEKESALEMLADIKRSGERAALLTSQLLAFSRKQILSPKVLDLNVVVTGMESLLKRVIGENLNFVTVLRPHLKPVRIDPNQLEQIILNLAINARDAMPSGGKLTLETSAMEVEESTLGAYLDARPGPHVVLAVSDTGIGMSPDVKERLFEPFFTTKEHGKGTGMGLATVYGIVKQSGGHIHVYTEPGKGSSFKIFFPAVNEGLDKDTPPEGKSPLVRGNGETILLVEDEELVRTYAHRVLTGLGYDVRMAVHGKEALKIIAEAPVPFRLLLTDVVMPEMSGRELWEKLKVLHPTTQVLFMSGYTDNAIVNQGVLDPDAPFLPKPFSPAQLAEKVGQVLSKVSTPADKI